MKRYSDLFKSVYDFSNLEIAYRKARKCKRYRNEVLRFSNNLEENLIVIQEQLIHQTYRQGRYRIFIVLEPKERVISALPFRDRVAQHAINNVIEPLIDKRFYEHSYACRKGKGMHKASSTLYTWIRNLSFDGMELYALKCDIHHYFKSIDHNILKAMLRRIFKDPQILWMLDLIIDSNDKDVGIPVGNLTSQLLANLYLDKLDKFIKEQLREVYYIRYMDDFIILSYDTQHLTRIWCEIETFLAAELRLLLNPKTDILCAKNGIDFCGYRHWKDHIKVRKSSVKRMKKRLRLRIRGKSTKEELDKSVQSWIGHIQHADTFRLQCKILGEISAIEANATI